MENKFIIINLGGTKGRSEVNTCSLRGPRVKPVKYLISKFYFQKTFVLSNTFIRFTETLRQPVFVTNIYFNSFLCLKDNQKFLRD